MLDNIEFILKILFFILSIIWAGKILILRTDKQIVINPVLIIVSSILVVVCQIQDITSILGVNLQYLRICLYSTYCILVLLGIYASNHKYDLF